MTQYIKKTFKTFVFLMIILKCSSNNFQKICKKTDDGNTNFQFTCTCTQDIKDFDVDSTFFENAKKIIITNCESVYLFPSIMTNELESLEFKNIHKLFLENVLNYKFKSLLIEDVGEVEKLQRTLFIQVGKINSLQIKNSKILSLDEHTFRDISVGNVVFTNVTIGHAKESSLNFTNIMKSSDTGVYFHKCIFEKLDSYAISTKGMETVRFLNSEFKTYEKHSFMASSFKTLTFDNNILPCNGGSSCDGTITDFVGDLQRATRGQNMCERLTKNYCNREKTKSLLGSLKKLNKCNLDFSKFGIDNSCLSGVKTETGNNADSHHSLNTHFIILITALKILIMQMILN